MSSSVWAISCMNKTNSLNWGGFKCLRVSLNIVRGIWIDTLGEIEMIVSISSRQDGLGMSEKAKTKTLVSSTRRIFFPPEFFACFAQFGNDLLFCHVFERIGQGFSQFTRFM